MADTGRMDQVYHYVMSTLVKRGQAPHYTEIARAMAVAPEEGKALLHELLGTGVPGWVHPDTDLLASLGPFNNLPTQYRISVAGEQRWFGQCGFESLAVCWLFARETITIDAPCLDCGAPLRVEVRDGTILDAGSEEAVAYVDKPFRNWRPNLADS